MGSTAGVTVRRLAPDDSPLGVEAIRVLKAPDGYPVPSIAHLFEFLSRPENVLIVALDDGVPVGYVVAYLLNRIDRSQQMMFFYEIGVALSHRRRGVGTQLVKELKAVCRENDVMKMWVPTGVRTWPRHGSMRARAPWLSLEETTSRTRTPARAS